MKGVCNIKVVNEDGTIAQDVTDENMVTDYLYRLVNPDYFIIRAIFGANDVLAYDKAIYPLIDKVIGGVFLFGENVPENEKCEFPIYSLVGHASSVHPYSLSTCGMFNINESEEIKDAEGKFKGYKYVWDFSTDRANGTIKCVSLTTGHAGQKGYAKSIDSKISNSLYFSPLSQYGLYSSSGLVDGYYAANIFETRTGNFLLESDTTSSFYTYYGNKFCRFKELSSGEKVLIANIDKNILIYITAMTKNSITFAHFQIDHTLSLSDKYYNSSTRGKNVFEKTINFERDVFPGKSNDNQNPIPLIIFNKIYTDDRFIYITGVVEHGCYVYKVDPKTFEILNIKEASDEKIKFNMPLSYDGGCAYFEGKFYAPIFYDSKDGSAYPWRLGLAKMNETNLADYEIVQDMTSGLYSSMNNINNLVNKSAYSIVNDMLFIIMCKSSGENDAESISIKNNKIVHHGTGFIPINSVDLEFPYHIVKGLEIINGRYGDSHSAYFGYGICTHGLITIDNLSTPIIKNSTQTMKITYEITEVDETV